MFCVDNTKGTSEVTIIVELYTPVLYQMAMLSDKNYTCNSNDLFNKKIYLGRAKKEC